MNKKRPRVCNCDTWNHSLEPIAIFQVILILLSFAPQNLLFKSSSEDSEIKVVDFGFARMKPEKDGCMKTPCFTLHYAAPEVLRQAVQQGAAGYDETCDWWSLGVILVSCFFYFTWSYITTYLFPKCNIAISLERTKYFYYFVFFIIFITWQRFHLITYKSLPKIHVFYSIYLIFFLSSFQYTMLSGRAPFQSRSKDDTSASIIARIKGGSFDMSGPEWLTVSTQAKKLIKGM